jgi:hypothetical protein
MDDEQPTNRPMTSPDNETAEPLPKSPYNDSVKTVWDRGWCTINGFEGGEAKAVVQQSPEGFHAELWNESSNSDGPTGLPYPTKQEAINAANEMLNSWWDGKMESLGHIEERSIGNFEKPILDR